MSNHRTKENEKLREEHRERKPVEAQNKWKEQQAKRDAALKKKEQEEDRKAKAAIKEKIERDKRERLAKAKPQPQDAVPVQPVASKQPLLLCTPN